MLFVIGLETAFVDKNLTLELEVLAIFGRPDIGNLDVGAC